jgi:hypothetical protein
MQAYYYPNANIGTNVMLAYYFFAEFSFSLFCLSRGRPCIAKWAGRGYILAQAL